MYEEFLSFKKLLDNNTIQIINKKLDTIVKNCSYLYIDEELIYEPNQEIYKNLKESETIFIDQIKEIDQTSPIQYFIICFKKNIFMIDQSSIIYLYQLLSYKKDLQIYFFADTKSNFDENIDLEYKEIKLTSAFQEEMNKIAKKFRISLKISSKMREIWRIIRYCIAGYILKQSYCKLNQNRIDNFFINFEKNFQIQIKEEDDFILLGSIGTGSIFKVDLFFHIENEELYAIKSPKIKDAEITKLMKREIENYSRLKHPLLPKFYGAIDNNIIIEYINGQTLENIEALHLTDNEKITIIFELMVTIEFFHRNHLIYRDLKPNNVIIDENKMAVLIDFDRVIDCDMTTEFSQNFASYFIDPEINYKAASYENDIYSLGLMIYYIISEEIPDNENPTQNKNFDIERLYQQCANKKAKERPSIIEILLEFYMIYHSRIKSINLFEIYKTYYKHLYNIQSMETVKKMKSGDPYFALGIFYMYEKYSKINSNWSELKLYNNPIESNEKNSQHNFNKAIYYFTLSANRGNVDAQLILGSVLQEQQQNIEQAMHYLEIGANQNNADAQLELSELYFNGNMVPRDINKTLYYLNLAASQNNLRAQYKLGVLYFNGVDVPRDINKAIYYISLAANQGHVDAQFELGNVYLIGKYVPKDIKKAINYLSAAADNGHPYAQVIIGMSNLTGYHIPKNVHAAIYYLELASLKNNCYAQLNLGLIYYIGQDAKQDIEKAIYYFSLAANQNVPEAQFCLGTIYYDNKYIDQDINKAIHYLSLAANQNYPEAQFDLGCIYYTGQSVKKDIDKAIHYFQLSSFQENDYAQYNLGLIYLRGIEVQKDINKAISYLNKSAENNNKEAQFMLGVLYYEGKDIERNINKCIKYLSLSANQNYISAQIMLGNIYYESKYVPQDFYKAIQYFSLAAEQNNDDAQFMLGNIYSDTKFTDYDINKSIHYFTLSAKQNHPLANYNLGVYYYNGRYIKKDVFKAIHYLEIAASCKLPEANFLLGYHYTKSSQPNFSKAFHYFESAANMGHPFSQFIVGLSYYEGRMARKNLGKGMYFLKESSKNRFVQAHFVLGYLYHEGKYNRRDMSKAISYYKEASSLNNAYAKNNLGIIYKNGFGNEVSKNVSLAIVYFNEAVQRTDNSLSNFNLASIYIYEQAFQNIDLAIDYLLDLYEFNVKPFRELLCIALILQNRCDLKAINNYLQKFSNKQIDSHKITNSLNNIIIMYGLNVASSFVKFFEYYRDIDFVFDHLLNMKISKSILYHHINQDQQVNSKIPPINSLFYEGFSIDLD